MMINGSWPTISLTQLMGVLWVTLGPALFAEGEWVGQLGCPLAYTIVKPSLSSITNLIREKGDEL